MPHADAAGPGRYATDDRFAGGVGLGREGRVDHDDVGDHVVVDVAAEVHHARLVEVNHARFVMAEQLQLEGLSGRERIDVVAYDIEIGKRHVRPHGDDQHK